MLPKNRVTVSVIIHKDVKEILDKYGDQLDLSTSRFARNLIYMGLEEFKLCKKNQTERIGFLFRASLERLKNENEGKTESF